MNSRNQKEDNRKYY